MNKRLKEIQDRKIEIRTALENNENVNLEEIQAELERLEKEANEILAKIEAVMTDPELGGDDAEAMDALIYDRNRSWVEKLDKMIPERAALVCVGAGHLPGDQGLLQLLRNRGYTVEPMQ